MLKNGSSVHLIADSVPQINKQSNVIIIQTEESLKSLKKGPQFPKAKRFKEFQIENNVGPGLYDIDNSMISSHLGTKLGLGNKSPIVLPHLLNNPGPGSYEIVDLNNLKTSITRGVKFPHSNHSSFDEILKSSIGPSVGTYEINKNLFKTKKKRKETFGKADRYNYIRIELPSLGPGKYDIIGKFLLNNKMCFGEKFGFSEAERLKQKMNKKLPGPGAYNVREIKKSRIIHFGKCKRPDIFVSTSVSPGPGAYKY